MTENSTEKQRRTGRGKPFVKGQSGNPAGKPKGARNAATLAAEALFDGEGEALTRKAVELALKGDTVAPRLCLERIMPARKSRKVSFALPAVDTAADLVPAFSAVLAASFGPVVAGRMPRAIVSAVVAAKGAILRCCRLSDR